MTFFSSAATSADTPASGVSLPEPRSAVCSPKPIDASADSCVEQELDRAIRELGEKMVQADRDGDPTGRDILCRRMYAAIRSRTPEHQARLTAEADQRIDEARTTNGVCYFSSDAAQELGRVRG